MHLFNHSENGVEIQFYVLMILAILLLKFKQKSQRSENRKRHKEADTGEKVEKKELNPSEWIKNISEIFYVHWKISKSWLLIVRNSLSKVIDNKLLTMLNSC